MFIDRNVKETQNFLFHYCVQNLLFLILFKLLFDFDKGMHCNSEFSKAHTVFEQKSCVFTVADSVSIYKLCSQLCTKELKK
jgi:hypothetical protein